MSPKYILYHDNRTKQKNKKTTRARTPATDGVAFREAWSWHHGVRDYMEGQKEEKSKVLWQIHRDAGEVHAKYFGKSCTSVNASLKANYSHTADSDVLCLQHLHI